MTNLHNQLTSQLLKLIDKQRPSKPSVQSVMESPVSIFYAIKQMYNSFKKDNESQILRNKIYDLKVYEQKKCINERKVTNAKMESLFCSHSKNQSIQLINNLLILKQYLPPHLQSQLISYIANQIMKIDDLPMVLSFFKMVLISKQSLNDKKGLYKQLELQMINKLISFQQMFSQVQIQRICTFLYGLPYFGIEILQLIALLFEKVQDISDFKNLGLLYTNIYTKLQKSEQSGEKSQLQQSFMKITTKQHLQIISQKISAIKDRKEKNERYTKDDSFFLNQLQEEAIRKMVQWSNKQTQQSSMYQKQLNEKQIQIINFIVLVLQCEAVGLNSLKQKQKIVLDYKVWECFINWYHVNARFSSWLYYVSDRLNNLFHNLFQSPKVVLKLIQLLLIVEAGLPAQLTVTLNKNMVTNLNQSISSYVIRQIISGQSNRNRYLLNKRARQIVAFGLTCDLLDIYYQIILNPSNLQYIDIILQLFDFPNCLQFLKQTLANINKKAILQKYLLKVLQQKPKKYTDFFIKIDSHQEGQIFQYQDYYLLRLFCQHISGQIAVCFIRQMATHTPSKYSLQIINTVIKSFQKKPEYKVIYYQSVRSLHVILSTYEAENLGVQFKKHLKDIVETKVIVGTQVFKNVPQKMINGLAAFYKSNESK